MFFKILLPTLLTAGALALFGCEGGGKTETPAPAPAAEAPAETAPAAEEAEPLVDQVVATINGTAITRRLFDSQLIMAEAGRIVFGDEASEDQEARRAADQALRLEIFSGLVSLELACQEALAKGYGPTEEEAEAALTALKNDFEDPEQLYKALDQYGQTEEELKAQLVKTMALKKWQENEFLPQMKVSDEESQAFYDQHPELVTHGEMVRASQIFVAVPIASPPAVKDKAREKAQGIMARLNAGEDFEKVALEASDDPDVAETRGDLGWLEKGQSVPLVDMKIFDLQPGQIGQMEESPLGFHIFKVTDVRAAGQEPFESVKGDIVDYLAGEKLGEAVQGRLLDLYSQADITINDPQLKLAFEAWVANQMAAAGRQTPAEPAEGQ